MSKKGDLFVGIVAGAFLGTIAGVLFAPDKGDNTRKKIQKEINRANRNLSQEVNKKMDKVKDQVNKYYEEAKTRFSEIEEEIKNADIVSKLKKEEE